MHTQYEVGQVLGHSRWQPIGQKQIDSFAKVVSDYQWIHVDEERASMGPYGGTIAHGYLTLGFVAPMVQELIPGAIGYWRVDRVRFLAPVRAGSRVRAVGVVAALCRAESFSLKLEVTLEIEGQEKPALFASGNVVVSL